MLAWKGVVFCRQRLGGVGSENEELSRVFKELQAIVGRWARLARATPDPQQEANWREEVRRLGEEKELLEADLSARSVAYP